MMNVNPYRSIERALWRPDVTPDNVIQALRDDGFHILSSIDIISEDVPPIPEEHIQEALSHFRYGQEPYRVLGYRAYCDGRIIEIKHRESRWTLLRYHDDESYRAHLKRKMAHAFLDRLGELLGLGD